MGLLVDGEWHDQWYDTKSTGGRFKRQDSAFRNWVTADGAPGPTGEGGFAAESGRYHLYVSLACPWAHRTLIFRAIKDLEPHISVSAVHPFAAEQGWTFDDAFPAATGDTLLGLDYAHQVYTRAKADYTGRVTVPILWDRERETIVSNESSEIIRMFNVAFNEVTGNQLNFYPSSLRNEIDALNARIYDTVNNGVYKCGFATSQAAYDENIDPLFETLDMLDARLAAGGPYLCGEMLTEADWRLFTTLVRFDPVYVGHFKCNVRRIKDYAALSDYVVRLYAHPGVAETVSIEHIKYHYYASHTGINPTGIVPKGPCDGP